jgi:hypothetical protein
MMRGVIAASETSMPRQAFALAVPDMAAFARALGQSLIERHTRKPEPPGHVELLNLLARAAGHRNIQALRATATLAPTPKTNAPPSALTVNAKKALGQFDEQGCLLRWPVKYSVQTLVMWAMWTRFDAKRVYTEKEINAVLKLANAFGDHVTLRRELINHRLMSRKSDCTEYRKLPARPDEETRAFLAAWRGKARGQ